MATASAPSMSPVSVTPPLCGKQDPAGRHRPAPLMVAYHSARAAPSRASRPPPLCRARPARHFFKTIPAWQLAKATCAWRQDDDALRQDPGRHIDRRSPCILDHEARYFAGRRLGIRVRHRPHPVLGRHSAEPPSAAGQIPGRTPANKNDRRDEAAIRCVAAQCGFMPIIGKLEGRRKSGPASRSAMPTTVPIGHNTERPLPDYISDQLLAAPTARLARRKSRELALRAVRRDHIVVEHGQEHPAGMQEWTQAAPQPPASSR